MGTDPPKGSNGWSEMAETEGARPLIVKRVTKTGTDAHHGGAWKVAYADFVTAMMAFFLLMWLLNATTEDQRKGLADYFDPSLPISNTSSGGAGMLSGDEIYTEEPLASEDSEGVRPSPTRESPGAPVGTEPDGALPTGPVEAGEAAEAEAEAEPDEAGADYAAAYKAEQERLASLGEEVAAAVAEAGSGLFEHFRLHMTPEGLVIEIVDADDAALFASGSAKPAPLLRRLIEILVPVLSRATNPLAVVGHTDAKPFGGDGTYSNWELSADRANTARRLIEAAGMAPERIARVTGRAATTPLVENPLAPQNRRIAITLLRQAPR